jgi:predicted ArsR family transcriptional regulator
LIFGDALGDITADEVLKAIRASANGLTRSDLSSYLGHNKTATEISRALTVLTRSGLVRSEREDAETGRPAERWFAINLGTKETNLTKEVPGEGR